MKRIFTFLFFLAPLLLSAHEKYTFIPAGNPAIHYIGRVDFSDPNRPVFSYPGITIEASFTGSYLDVLLEEGGQGGEEHTNYFNIIIDDHAPIVIALSPTRKVYHIADTLSKEQHFVKIFKRTESSVGKVYFKGLHLEHGHTVYPFADSTKSRKIELIGDSFGCGYGNEISVGPPPQGDPNTGFHSKHENNYSAWCAIVCRNLNAEYMCTTYSGRGLLRNNTGSTYSTMPLIYDQIIADDESTKWDHSKYHPDVILIALGANDFFTGVPDSSSFVNTYIHFVKYLRTLHPNASIVCIAGNGMSDWWPEGEFRWTHTQNYIQSVVSRSNAAGDSNVYYLMLSPQTPPYGEDWHPSNATHALMATTVTAYLRKLKSW